MKSYLLYVPRSKKQLPAGYAGRPAVIVEARSEAEARKKAAGKYRTSTMKVKVLDSLD